MAKLTRVSDTTLMHATDMAALRKLEPVRTGQLATLGEYHAGTGIGGGRFRGVLGTSPGADNGGTIIRTSGGNTWVRLNAHVTNPLMFGARCDTAYSDHAAIYNAVKASEYGCDGLGRTYYLNDTVYLNTIEARRAFYNARLYSMADLPDGRPMLRMCNDQYLSKLFMDGSQQNKGTIGILWEGGRTTAPFGGIEDCEFRYIGSQAIYVGCDYDAGKFATRGYIRNIRAFQCGSRGVANGRATIGMDGVSDFTVDGVIATKCNWGIYFRNDLNKAGVTRKGGNKLVNSTFYGSGRTHETFTDAQGISASFQDGLKIDNVHVADFADNAIDMQYCDASQVSNWRATQCKDGVFMGDRGCRRHVISNGVAIDCDRAVRLTTDGSDGYMMGGTRPQLLNIQIVNVHAYNPQFEGFWIKNTGKSLGSTMRDVKLIGCTVDASGTYNNGKQTVGFNINGGESILLDDCYVINVANQAVWIENSEFVTVTSLNAQNIDRSGKVAYAVHAVNSPRTSILDARVYGSSTGKAVGIHEGCNNSRVEGTRWRGVSAGVDVSGSSTNVTQINNLQY